MMKQALVAMLVTGAMVACAESSETVGPDLDANIVLHVPEDSPGPPFYTLIQPGWFPMTEDWAAVAWLRDPACVPGDFNLLRLFDPPPTPFLCALTIEGHEIWNTEPPSPVGAKNILVQGLGAVPMYFVSTGDLLPAIADGVITIDDLEAMASLRVGYADKFTLTQQTGTSRGRPGEGKINIVASGALEDGGTFRFHTAEGPPKKPELAHVSIEFR